MKNNILNIYKKEQKNITNHKLKSLGLLFVVTVVVILTNTFATSGIKAIIDFNNNVNVIINNHSYIDLLLSFILLSVIVFYQRVINKHSFNAIGLNKNSAFKHYFIGLIFGLSMLSVIVVTGNFLQILTIKSDPFKYLLIIIYFIGFVIKGISEQLFYTSFIFSEVNAKSNIYVGIFVTGFIYALVNIINPSFNYIAFANTFLFGALYCSIYYKTQNIWLVSAIYTSFKFAEANIFGLAVSNIAGYENIFKTTLTSDIFLTGGAFGIKASILTTPVILLALIITILLIKKGKKKNGNNNK